jgi:hypothetical protein
VGPTVSVPDARDAFAQTCRGALPDASGSSWACSRRRSF